MERTILKWAQAAQEELNCFSNIDETVRIFSDLSDKGLLKYEELPEDAGVVAYMIVPDLRGNKICSELFMYIRPEYRGSIAYFKEIINILENAGKNNACKFVSVGANIGYRDTKLLRLLEKFGYYPETVRKEV